jgi:hypothetical protein
MIEEEATSQGSGTAQPSRGHGKLTLAIVLILGIAVGIALVLAVESWRSSDDDNLVPVETVQPAAPTAPAPLITPSPPAPDEGDPLAGAVWPLPDSKTRYTDRGRARFRGRLRRVRRPGDE